MNTYTVALSDIRHPETGGVIVKCLSIYSAQELRTLEQEYGIDDVHGLTMSTYEDALAVQEDLLFDLYLEEQAEGRAVAAVRAVVLAPATVAVVDGEGGSDGDIDFDFDGEGAGAWAGVPAPVEFDDLPF